MSDFGCAIKRVKNAIASIKSVRGYVAALYKRVDEEGYQPTPEELAYLRIIFNLEDAIDSDIGGNYACEVMVRFQKKLIRQ